MVAFAVVGGAGGTYALSLGSVGARAGRARRPISLGRRRLTGPMSGRRRRRSADGPTDGRTDGRAVCLPLL